jgi:hypothetical protein
VKILSIASRQRQWLAAAGESISAWRSWRSAQRWHNGRLRNISKISGGGIAALSRHQLAKKLSLAINESNNGHRERRLGGGKWRLRKIERSAV